MPTQNLIIFASGTGSNAQKIIDFFRNDPSVHFKLIVCNKPGAGVLDIAEKEHIPTLLIEKEQFFRGNGYVDELKACEPTLIILAGFLWKLPACLVKAFPHQIINIHPALLPKYGGKGMYGHFVHEAVLASGDRETGITIHYVDELYDHGDYIFQARVPVEPSDTPETIAKKVQVLEHSCFPKVVKELLDKKSESMKKAIARLLTAYCFLLTASLLFSAKTYSQDILVSGLVLDSTRKFILPNVKVTSTSGRVTYTDSTGSYNIMVTSNDSINFTYRNKPTMWYPVREMKNTRSFDIALQVTLTDGYKTLREVILIGKSYRQDSIENRMKYQKVFNGSTGGLRINPSGGDNLYGGAGLDPNEIINLFRFRRNRNLKSLQNRLLQEESEKFINYRFNKDLVKQITGFSGSNLERFMKIWRPDYEFTALSTELEFHTYILEASRAYTRGEMPWRSRE